MLKRRSTSSWLVAKGTRTLLSSGVEKSLPESIITNLNEDMEVAIAD
jgi:hypothetical protein